MSVSLSAWYDYVLPHVPGVTTTLADSVIRSALVAFCSASKKWRYDVPAITTVADDATYTLTPEAGAQVIAVIAARYDGEALGPTNEEELDRLIDGWREDTGTPTHYMLDAAMTTMTLVLTPSEAVTGGLEVEIAQAPTLAATSFPDWLMNLHHEAIASGALARLYEMPKKPWSDGGLATYHTQRFNAAIGRADTEGAKANTRMPLRVRARSGVI